MANKVSLGARLRNLRKERRLTQRQLADQATISVNAVSLIERDENSPSVATLQSLASALNVKMSYFFDEDVPKKVLHVRASERPSITSSGARIEGIGERLQGQELEPFIVFLDPHSGSGDHVVVHSGHEFVYCIRGVVEYHIDREVHLLEEGDMLLFEAGLPHQWFNPSEEHTELLLILQTPNESNDSVQRHFPSHPSLIYLS